MQNVKHSLEKKKKKEKRMMLEHNWNNWLEEDLLSKQN